MARVGIAEVAAQAGVSVTTVSHVLSGRRPVAPTTKTRVLDVIKRLGYQPDTVAQGLRTRRTMTVGLLVPDLTNPFYPMVLRGLTEVLVPAGYHTLVCDTDGARKQEVALLRTMAARRVDGVVIAPFQITAKDLSIYRHDLPLVRLGGGPFDGDLGDLVRSDDEGGMAQAVRCLLDDGRQRLAYIGGPQHTGPSERREAGFRRALADAGRSVDEDLVVRADFTREAGREAAEALLRGSSPPRDGEGTTRPDSVACANDLIAIGVLDAARSLGLRVPDQLAVTGYDDIDAASLVTPALTTVANPARQLGRACGEAILRQLSGEESEPARELVIANSLIRRGSA